jgi:hypothetical protein
MRKLDSSLITVTLSDESYAGLFLKMAAFYQSLDFECEVLASHIESDRFSKKAYYFAALKKGATLTATPFKKDEET